MFTITTYKGVVLKENFPFHNKTLGHCPYAVYLTNGNRFQFSSIAEFKRVVNATDPSLGIMELDSDGKWHGAGVKQKDFREYALAHQITDGLKFSEPTECEFFTIEQSHADQKKYITVDGFTWCDEDKWHYTSTRYQGIPLETFIEHYKAEGMDYIYRLETLSYQIQEDVSKKDLVKYYLKQGPYGIPPVARLSFEDITLNTPCGLYIC